MKHSYFFLLFFVLASCAQFTKPVGNWIDVPLRDNTFYESQAPYTTGSYDIPISAQEALEFSLNIVEGDSIVYQWNVEMIDSSELETEFHGHTERIDDKPGTVMFYKIHQDKIGKGSLVAPFSGLHGWYFNNKSDEDIVIHLSVSGFYAEGNN